MNVCRISPEKLCTEFRHLNSRITIDVLLVNLFSSIIIIQEIDRFRKTVIIITVILQSELSLQISTQSVVCIVYAGKYMYA